MVGVTRYVVYRRSRLTHG